MAEESLAAQQLAAQQPVAGLRRPIRDRLHTRLVEGAVARGANKAEAEAVVAELAGERPLLDWLLNGGFEKLIEMILTLIKLK